ncbi:TIGR01777 family protein [Boudabousia liubingyangii]|uniref:TIGR01777 family oxidoreductase n=1 Tax=Boudabousia liubingyangii TaxID=1921764 RepID=UPI00093AC08B|nr:TIGR01777 family oxidoreductase [Boudabousia liubingyangii]OKL46864.1 TIGR01777 family protein [Boudabousia liubingyangii]
MSLASQPLLIIAGAGLIGSALADHAEAQGWQVRILRRSDQPDGNITKDQHGRQTATWNPSAGQIDLSVIAGAQAIACFNGAAIAPQPWTASRKELLATSRLASTKVLAKAIAALPESQRPEVFLSGSAIGYYGSQGDRLLGEDAVPGFGFLAQLCERWEAAAEPAQAAGVRVVNPRTGLVISNRGGIGQMLDQLYRHALGARLGDGQQWQVYISLRDAVASIWHVLNREDFVGPFNMVCPEPIRNANLHQFCRGFYSLPNPWVAPKFALKLLGQMGEELLLASQRVVPTALLESGFEFQDLTVPQAWEHEFGEK